MSIKKIDGLWAMSGKGGVCFVGKDFDAVMKAASAYFWGRV